MKDIGGFQSGRTFSRQNENKVGWRILGHFSESACPPTPHSPFTFLDEDQLAVVRQP